MIMVKYFVGSDVHFIAFDQNLFKHDKCVHIKRSDQIYSGMTIYKVAGSEIADYLHDRIMNMYIKGDINLEVMPENLLYKTI